MNGDEESFLILFMHGPTDGANGPAQRVQVPPGPFGTVHLIMKLLCHDPLRIRIVQMSQVDYTGETSLSSFLHLLFPLS